MYHYTGCGLRNVWLTNGYHTRLTPYGEGVVIEDVLGLHRAIGSCLISNRKRLTGAEFRFLRKEQEISQKRLGEILGADAQAIARWETGKTSVPKWADHFARVLYHEYVSGDGTVRNVIEKLNTLDAHEHAKLRFRREGQDWRAKAA